MAAHRTNINCPRCGEPLWYEEKTFVDLATSPEGDLVADLITAYQRRPTLTHPDKSFSRALRGSGEVNECVGQPFETIGTFARVPVHGDPHRDDRPTAIFGALGILEPPDPADQAPPQ